MVGDAIDDDELEWDEDSESLAVRATVIVISPPASPALLHARELNRCAWNAWCRVMRSMDGAGESKPGQACDCGPGDCYIPLGVLE